MTQRDLAIEHLAYMAFKKRVSFFLGTGFSKSLVHFIPTWMELAENICKRLNIEFNEIKSDKKGMLRSPENILSIAPYFTQLDECSSGESYDTCCKKKIRELIAKYIDEVSPTQEVIQLLGDYKKSFENIKPNRVFTTNYDNVTHLPFNDPKIVSPNPHYDIFVGGTRIVHIHGHIDNPQEMIVFEEDFLRFNSENKYIHNLLYSSFVENTTIFIGYSLNDPNIKQILFNIAKNELKEFYVFFAEF